MNKMEFSKKIIIFTSIFTIFVTVFSIVLMWKTNDTSGLAYLIPSVFAELATATGFYYWKARTENKIKLLKTYGDTAEKALNEQRDYYNGGF